MSENTSDQLKNPLLGGFYPDPSICRVDSDFYLVTSSFELFPGLPVFHSRDMVHWEQIGNALDRIDQLHVVPNSLTGGLMAPTIRWHNGVFYIIDFNLTYVANFIVTATDPAGPWSDPVWLDDVPGLDASIFFDDDDRCYVLVTGITDAEGKRQRAIHVCEFDVRSMRTVGDYHAIWTSALREAASPEAPHLYKKDGWYYLVIAEGGTEHYHAVTIARSRDLFAWFTGNPANPIMTHRHLGKYYPIANAGHADLVELPDGSWYAVLLASRLLDGYHKNLGRETYGVPVAWEEGWPVMSPGTGKIEWNYDAPALPAKTYPALPVRDDFDSPSLAPCWVFWGTPYQDFWKIQDSRLMLNALPRPLAREVRPINIRPVKDQKKVLRHDNVSFLGRRQTNINYDMSCQLAFAAESEQEAAGIVIMQASNHQFRLEKSRKGQVGSIRLVLATNDINNPPHWPGFTDKTVEKILAEIEYPARDVIFKVSVRSQSCDFYYGPDQDNLTCLLAGADARLINPEIVGGMVGTCLGMFASANGTPSENRAMFDWFDYQGWDELT